MVPPERTNRTSQTLVCTGFEVLPQHQPGSFRHRWKPRAHGQALSTQPVSHM